LSLAGKVLRKISSIGKLDFNVTSRDRETWHEGEVLFNGDLAATQSEWLFHPKYQDPAELSFNEGTMHFAVKAATADEWAYIYLDPQKYNWRNYSWQMKFRRMTEFQEYAFNFRYVDFDNRYRYRFEDDLLFFDSKVKGKWVCHKRIPFPMALGAWYDLRIDTREDRHRCYVNGMLMMENRQGSIPRGSISIILWEIDNVTDCLADVGPSMVKRLV
jgi:hypothetical protein